jgi:hypothetical protein
LILRRSKATSLAIVSDAYVVAIAAAAAWLAWGPASGRLWLDSLLADAIATVVVFAFSRAYRNSSFEYRDVIDRVSKFVPRPPG